MEPTSHKLLVHCSMILIVYVDVVLHKKPTIGFHTHTHLFFLWFSGSILILQLLGSQFFLCSMSCIFLTSDVNMAGYNGDL